MTKTAPSRPLPATIDFTALHDALAAGKTLEEAEAIGRGEAPVAKAKPATTAPDDSVGGAE